MKYFSLFAVYFSLLIVMHPAHGMKELSLPGFKSFSKYKIEKQEFDRLDPLGKNLATLGQELYKLENKSRRLTELQKELKKERLTALIPPVEADYREVLSNIERTRSLITKTRFLILQKPKNLLQDISVSPEMVEPNKRAQI